MPKTDRWVKKFVGCAVGCSNTLDFAQGTKNASVRSLSGAEANNNPTYSDSGAAIASFNISVVSSAFIG